MAILYKEVVIELDPGEKERIVVLLKGSQASPYIINVKMSMGGNVIVDSEDAD